MKEVVREVVIYTGDHCQPCRMLKSVLDSKKVPYEARNGKDYEGIVSVPTVDLIENGEVSRRIIGLNSEGLTPGTTINLIQQWIAG